MPSLKVWLAVVLFSYNDHVVLRTSFATTTITTVDDSSGSTVQCGNTTTYCPVDKPCCHAHYSPTGFGCQVAEDGGSSTPTCCMPGPELEPSTKLPNCLILGDSVSIGYTAQVTSLLENACLVQHGPWDVSDGGAGDTKLGQTCLDIFTKTQRQTHVDWDVVLFNFGLHDLNASHAAVDAYRTELTNITNRLSKKTPTLMYATTTPFMPDALEGNFVVDTLNNIATEEVLPSNTPIVDLNRLVHDHCGALYATCDWCDSSPCSFHYSELGRQAQAMAVAKALREQVLLARGPKSKK